MHDAHVAYVPVARMSKHMRVMNVRTVAGSEREVSVWRLLDLWRTHICT